MNLASMKAAVWFEPEIVAEIQYQCWSRGYLRHGSFKGPRDDREPGEIRLPYSPYGIRSKPCR
jgi:ATP-dependent DNA ligase